MKKLLTFILVLAFIAVKPAAYAQTSAFTPSANAVTINAENVDYNPGYFCEKIANQFTQYYSPGEGKSGYRFQSFVLFFSKLSKNARCVSPVIQLEYSDKTSVLIQLYTDDPTGIQAAVVCGDGTIKTISPNFTEMLSPLFSCWGYPADNFERHTWGSIPYYTQWFVSRCGNYRSQICYLPYAIENYNGFSSKLDYLGVCKTGSLHEYNNL